VTKDVKERSEERVREGVKEKSKRRKRARGESQINEGKIH
jgi:hypothetical protein